MRKISQLLILVMLYQVINSTTLLANNNYSKINSIDKNLVHTNKTFKPSLQLPKDTLITRHSPKLNGGARVEGSIRVLLAESFDINGNAKVIGDIYVPGNPEIKTSSGATYKATLTGEGNEYPSDYTIKLNGSSTIRHLVTCSDAVAISSIPPVIETQGTRDVFLIKGEQPGDFSTIRDLVLTRKYNLMLAIPEGNYGVFRAHGRSGFILGIDNQETTYNLQSLELNTNSLIEIRGKVTINIKNSLVLNSNARMGQANKPTNLLVNVENGEVKLNSESEFYGIVNAPDATFTLNSNSKLVGQVICDRANFNSNSLLKNIFPF